MKTDCRTDCSFSFILNDSLKDYREFLLKHSAPPISIARHTAISSGGSPSPCVYFLLDGLVKVSVLNVHGYERILGYHRKNSLFVMDGLRQNSSVVVTTTALTPLSVLQLSAQDLTGLFRKNPQFATDLLLYYSDVLKLMCYDAESQSSNSVLSKLANFIVLYMQSEDYHALGYLPFSQSELASAIGASRVQVSRVCSALRKEGAVEIQKKKLRILTPARFQSLVSFHGFE